jgi:hypothetical protein
MVRITGSVGVNGRNLPVDVKTVQELLNRVPPGHGGPAIPLKVDGLCFGKTTASIERFQKVACEFKWPDRLVAPNRKTWFELEKYDRPVLPGVPAAPDVDEAPRKCGTHLPELGASLAPGGASSSFFVGRYLPVPLDAWQRSVARSVFGTSLDLDAIFVVYRAVPGGAKGVCLVGPLKGQNTLILSTSVKELLIHELTHVWQSQHHSVPGKYMWNSLASQRLAEQRGESAYWFVPGKPFGEYAAEQIADQVEAGEDPIIAHVRSRFARFKDPLNTMSLQTPRTEPRNPKVAKRAPTNY